MGVGRFNLPAKVSGVGADSGISGGYIGAFLCMDIISGMPGFICIDMCSVGVSRNVDMLGGHRFKVGSVSLGADTVGKHGFMFAEGVSFVTDDAGRHALIAVGGSFVLVDNGGGQDVRDVDTFSHMTRWTSSGGTGGFSMINVHIGLCKSSQQTHFFSGSRKKKV